MQTKRVTFVIIDNQTQTAVSPSYKIDIFY